MIAQIHQTTELDENEVQALRARVHGDLIRPDDPAYDEARKVQNGLIDRRPALIVRASGTTDVIEAVNFARDHHMLLSVRGGAHNVAGHAVNNGGIVIDLSPMRSVWVDPKMRTVRVGGGATWADVDRETQVFGLATPGGNVSTTGVGGLTLHGGMGHLRRKYGLSIDNLISVDIVTADGQLRRASAMENPDLYWAVRGAGSNFGVVTSFEFRLHPVGPLVYFCGVFYPIEAAPEALPKWRDLVQSEPEELSSFAALWSVPPAPVFPPEIHGKAVFLVASLYSGPASEGDRQTQALRSLASPLFDMSGPLPYTTLQSAIDGAFVKGMQAYWKSLYLDHLTDDAISTLIRFGKERPSPFTQVAIWNLGGAIRRVGPTETAYTNRQAPFMISFDSLWIHPDETDRNIQWTRNAWSTIRQSFTGSGLYPNFPGLAEDQDVARMAYGPNYDRLVEIKNKYDPDNLFRMNLNIQPKVE